MSVETRRIYPSPRAYLEIAEFIGYTEPLHGIWHRLANCCYERPAWGATLLPDGRVLVDMVDNGVHHLFSDRGAFEAWRRAALGRVRDPETGREQAVAACLARMD